MSNDVPPLSPRQHIVQIRRNKFGLDAEGRRIAENALAEDLHNAVDHLSEGLYSKDVHFVLELIQNAEDNRYAEGVAPELRFRLLPDDPTATPGACGALLIVNNEAGLRPEDVNALCAVGRSTKTKQQGYIGEKGIGFKSVFKVTRRPFLFSAGYQFRFDREEDPEAKLGYIIPYWVDAAPDVVADQGDRTCILLPIDADQWERVVDHLNQIAPETILFLRRLEALSVELPDRSSLELHVDKSRAPLVELLDGSRSAVYWLHHQEAPRPPDLNEEKRFGIGVRTVSVAFPLETAKEPEYSVFAYLPTEIRSGLPFLINADFLLTSSREAILEDRPWNHWLRDEIAPCFVEGFTRLVHDDRYRRQAYRFIPLRETVSADFFEPIATAIHQMLADRPVVWALGRKEPVAPTQARLAPRTFRRLLDDDRPLPKQLRATPLVAPELEQFAKQLRAIGVKPLEPAEVRACLQEREWLKKRSPEWFLNLYVYLQKEGWRTTREPNDSRSLYDLPIIPAQNSRLTVVGAKTVYLPAREAQQIVRKHAELLGDLDVSFLNADLYRLLEGQPETLTWVKQNLAKPWTPQDYCRDLVRAIAQNHELLSAGQLVEATRVVRDLIEQAPEGQRRDLCKELPLLLDDDRRTTIKEGAIVTPTNLDPQTGWQEAFPDPEDRADLHIHPDQRYSHRLRILSDRYLDGCLDETERKRWRAFFKALGLTDTPVPQQQWWWSGTYTNHSVPSDIPGSLREQIVNANLTSSRGYVLVDIRPPRWLATLATTGDVSITPARARALIQWLKRGIDNDLIQQAYLRYFYYTDRSLLLRSEFPHLLQTAPWFPTTKGFRRPGEAFLKTREVCEIFGETVPYAAPEIDLKLATWLGIRLSATTDEVLKYLEELSKRRAADVDAALVERIYSFLLERWRYGTSETANRFAQNALIRVSHPAPRWVRSADCIWADRADVFGEEFAYLERDYPPHLKDFFVRHLGIKPDVDDELYARAWLRLQQASTLDPVRIEAALERIFPVLRRVAENDGAAPQWWRSFLSQARVWTQSDRFVAPAEAYIPDDGELRKRLGEAGAEFVWRLEKDGFADNEALYQALGVRRLTEATRCTLANVSETRVTPPGEERYLRSAFKQAICCYLWSRNREEFRRLKAEGLLEAILGAREVRVERLELHYQLGRVCAASANAPAYFDRNDRVLYLSDTADEPDLEIEIPFQLARAMSGTGRPDDEVKHVLASMLGKTDQHVQKRIEREGWSLPAEEHEWMEGLLSDYLNPAQLPADQPADEATMPATQDDAQEPAAAGAPTAEMKVPLAAPHAAPAPSSAQRPVPAPAPRTMPPKPAPPSTPDGRDRPRTTPGSDQRRDGLELRESPLPTGTGAQAGGRSPSHPTPSSESNGDHDSRPRRSVHVEWEEPHQRPSPVIDPDKRRAIEQAGIEAVIQYEWAHSRRPRCLDHDHPGYDIESFAAHARDGDPPDRCIEVKATEAEWTEWGVALTSAELETALHPPAPFYLYVVEYALDDERRRIFIVASPADKITEYRFGRRWREAADEVWLPSATPHAIRDAPSLER